MAREHRSCGERFPRAFHSSPGVSSLGDISHRVPTLSGGPGRQQSRPLPAPAPSFSPVGDCAAERLVCGETDGGEGGKGLGGKRELRWVMYEP